MGGAKARQYILNQYKEIGLQPYSGNGIYPFRPSQQISSQMLGKDSLNNIIMIIPGSDPQLKNEYIVLGAHYDHVGIKGGKVYNGADDNASGSTALIEIARELYAHRSELKRSVIIAAFDGEEEGLFGSKEMVKMLGKDIDKVKVMLSIDMVGWLSANDALIIEGSSTLKGGKETLQQLGEPKLAAVGKPAAAVAKGPAARKAAPNTEPISAMSYIPAKMESVCKEKQIYLQQGLTLMQLSTAVGVNRTYLSKWFAQQGTTFNAYINKLRVEYFMNRYIELMAEEKTFSAQELALKSGFQSYRTFYNAFLQVTGQSFSSWMKKYQ